VCGSDAGWLSAAFYRVHRATFEDEIGRIASGKSSREVDPDELLQRALGDVSMRLARRQADACP
jgi:hypothetical protein